MSYLVSFTRKMYLVSYTHILETQLKRLTEQKLNLTDSITQISSQINDINDAESPAVKKLKARELQLETLEKKMDMRMQKIQTQLQAAQTELQSADQALQQSIKNSFSYNYGG